MVDPTALGIPWKRQLWHKWKSLRRVPLRRSWFVGYDLEGNSYWELVDHNNPSRLRRKVSLDRPYFHFSDFKAHPMWLQWMQFTRPTPPTLEDLMNDVRRQHRLKLLAQQADAKWKSLPLRTGKPGASNDERMDTAWSGGPAPVSQWGPTSHSVNSSSSSPSVRMAEPQEVGDARENSAATESASPTAEGGNEIAARQQEFRKAMDEVERLNTQDPKVYRDAMGQVKMARPAEKGPEGAEEAVGRSSSGTSADKPEDIRSGFPIPKQRN